jgi:hypothetical protein
MQLLLSAKPANSIQKITTRSLIWEISCGGMTENWRRLKTPFVSISGKTAKTLSQGIYTSISASGNAILTLNPGVYLIEGGGYYSLTGSTATYSSDYTVPKDAQNRIIPFSFPIGSTQATTKVSIVNDDTRCFRSRQQRIH